MRRQTGFTLVEILVAISVAALLVSLVYGIIRIGQRSAAAVDSQVEQTEIMRIGWEFLHAALSRASPVPDPEDPQDATSFAGGAKFLSFVADMPAYIGTGGLMRISLEIDDSTEQSRLVVSRLRFDRGGAPQAEDAGDSAVLVEDLETLDISYYGQTQADDPPTWHAEWQEPRILPNLVRVAVKPADGPAWPRLTVSPLAGASQLDEDSPAPDEEENGEPSLDQESPDGETPEGQELPIGQPTAQEPT